MNMIKSFWKKSFDFKSEATITELLVLVGVIFLLDVTVRILVQVNVVYGYIFMAISAMGTIPSLALIIRYINTIFRDREK